DIDASLSSSSAGGSGGDDSNAAAAGGQEKTRQSRLKPGTASGASVLPECDKHQAGDRVEARFGGRSKWFPGKVRRTHGGVTGKVLYDIDFDDGDKEEGVLASRVRSPGQTPPALQAGLVVDVKLARKGKGYHPGTIGRVNDDGSLYVKLDDGDSEWSLPVQQVIPGYPFTPPPSTTVLRGSSAGTNSDTAAIPESPGETNASRDPDKIDEQRGTAGGTPRRRCSNPPTSAFVRGGDFPGQQAETGSTTPEASSSTQPPVDQQNKQLGEQPKTGENGGGGSGLSWIAEVADSVEPSVSAANAEIDNQPDRGGCGGGGGLDWVAEPMSPLGWPDPRESTASIAESNPPMPNPNHGRGFSLSPTVGPTTNIPAGATGAEAGVPTTPVTMRQKRPPLAQTPPHLEWKPIKDGSANRTWGAPPLDEEDMVTDEKQASKGGHGAIMASTTQQQEQEQQHQLKSPPRLSRNLVAPASSSSSSAAAAAAATPSNAPTSSLSPHRQQDVAVAPDGNPGDRPDTTPAGLPDKQIEPAAGDAQLRSGGEDKKTAEVAGGVLLGVEEAVGNENNTPPADAATAGDKSTLRGEQQDLPSSGASAQGERERRLVAPTERPGESQNKLTPRAEKVSPAPGQGGSSGSSSTRWAILRSSVQRRYAAEAMHAAEEVRLLAAKLKAGDDKMRERLEQQERKLVGQMEEALQRELDKVHTLWKEERAASARRISSLKEDLDTANRRLESERNRNTKARDRKKESRCLGGSDTRSSPEITHHLPHLEGRNGPEISPRCSRSNSNATAAAAASSAATRTTPWGRAARSTGNRLPPPPMSATTPVGGFGSASPPPATTGYGGVGGGVGGGGGVDIGAAVSAAAGRHKGETDIVPPPPPPQQKQRQETPETVLKPDAAVLAGRVAPAVVVDPCFSINAELSAVDGGLTGRRETAVDCSRIGCRHREESLRWKLETERRDTRRRLEAMKGEVERVVGQFQMRAERAEATAASAEKRAAVKALRYLRSKRSPSPVPLG
ncbi:unnamed protein product, partial [Pylaiella littoralis]